MGNRYETRTTVVLRKAFLEAGAVMIRLVSPPAVHHDDQIAVVHDLLPTIHAVVLGRAAALIARGDVCLRFLRFSHGCLLRS